MHGGYGQEKYHMPGLRELEWWERVGFIEQPDQLVKKAATLLSSEHWEEVVVGLALITGRCVSEVLKSGVIVPKKQYSLLFTSYQEQVDAVLGPFELPTLVEAEAVFSAWHRVRELLDCKALPASEICARYRPAVCESAEHHFERYVPVDEHQDWYAPLYLRIYPLIATRYYCPIWIKSMWFKEIIRGFRWPLSYEGACKPHCQECIRPCCVYEVGDGVSNIDGRQGLKLDQEGVEPLERIDHLEEDGLPGGSIANVPADWEEEDGEIMEWTDDRVLVETDGLMNGHLGLKPSVPSVEVFQQRGGEEEKQRVLSEQESDAEPEANVDDEVDNLTALTRGSLQEAEEGVSTRSTQQEPDRVEHLLACFVFEVQMNLIEDDHLRDVLDTLATLVEHAPLSVMELVERLRCTPPEEQEDDYPDTLPSFVGGDR